MPVEKSYDHFNQDMKRKLGKKKIKELLKKQATEKGNKVSPLLQKNIESGTQQQLTENLDKPLSFDIIKQYKSNIKEAWDRSDIKESLRLTDEIINKARLCYYDIYINRYKDDPITRGKQICSEYLLREMSRFFDLKVNLLQLYKANTVERVEILESKIHTSYEGISFALYSDDRSNAYFDLLEKYIKNLEEYSDFLEENDQTKAETFINNIKTIYKKIVVLTRINTLPRTINKEKLAEILEKYIRTGQKYLSLLQEIVQEQEKQNLFQELSLYFEEELKDIDEYKKYGTPIRPK